MKLVFLVEEASMRDTLNGLLPRVLPAGVTWQCIPHEGKSDLEKSIPRKLRAWKEPDVRFVVLRDQDSADCEKVKTRLVELCRQGGKADVLVRVVCRDRAMHLIPLAPQVVVAGRGRLPSNRVGVQ